MRNLFIPVFLNCWLAKHSLENMFVSTSYKLIIIYTKFKFDSRSTRNYISERPTSSNAEVPIGIESTADDP